MKKFMFVLFLGIYLSPVSFGAVETTWTKCVVSEIQNVLSLTPYKNLAVDEESLSYVGVLGSYRYFFSGDIGGDSFSGEIAISGRRISEYDSAIRKVVKKISCSLFEPGLIQKNVAAFTLRDEDEKSVYSVLGTNEVIGSRPRP